MLWAAKEALRKVAATPALPGFLDLVLAGVDGNQSGTTSGAWRMVFQGKAAAAEAPAAARCSVAVCHGAGYVLALTARTAAADAAPDK